MQGYSATFEQVSCNTKLAVIFSMLQGYPAAEQFNFRDKCCVNYTEDIGVFLSSAYSIMIYEQLMQQTTSFKSFKLP